MSGHLGAFLHPARPPRVLLVGDMILDRYLHGSSERVSPEAPIMVLTATREEHRAGGCGNVAANLRALGADVACVSVVGADDSAAKVRELFAAAGLRPDGLIVDDSRPTIRKTRVVAQSQQLLRIDEEQARALAPEVETRLLLALERELPAADIVVVSDYGKGVLTDAVLERLCRPQAAGRRPRVLVDPKGRHYARYRGATILTPNKLEAETATGIALDGDDGIRRAALQLCRMADLEAAIITLGARGMYCCLADGSREWSIPARARSVYDVTGAGDTVIATLAFALANGAEIEAAMQLATAAAGVKVQRFGVVAVTPAEIETALLEGGPSSDKVVERDELLRRLAIARAAGRRIVFTNGCFDVLHVGHLEYLQEARGLGDVLVVAVNDDESVRRQGKGPGRPVNRAQDRAALLAGLECVSLVTLFAEDTPLELIRAVSPDVLVKGADWEGQGVVGQEWVESRGGKVVLARLREGYSTTETLRRMGSA
ncbi:MAG TPA: bifunctional heptose 7-phosphate kinase/heptose 1-phosphate adenyltransferase [Planctomycetota bacterium]|nr:bifunctional heptose 7-phosphate kinase/heptose 1-phosphate adenyltransferase [Planctomycetota bacterium]